MPTVYTQFIEDGKIDNGKDFLKLCTRALGVMFHLSDDPLSIPDFKKALKVKTKNGNDINKSELKKYKKELAYWRSMSIGEAENLMIKNNDEVITFYKNRRDEAKKLIAKYDKVRAEVCEWAAPTKDHRGLKYFALEQIDLCLNSLRYQANWRHDEKEIFNSPIKFIKHRVNDCIWNINFHKAELEKDLARNFEKNEWIKEFLKSIGV